MSYYLYANGLIYVHYIKFRIYIDTLMNGIPYLYINTVRKRGTVSGGEAFCP